MYVYVCIYVYVLYTVCACISRAYAETRTVSMSMSLTLGGVQTCVQPRFEVLLQDPGEKLGRKSKHCGGCESPS